MDPDVFLIPSLSPLSHGVPDALSSLSCDWVSTSQARRGPQLPTPWTLPPPRQGQCMAGPVLRSALSCSSHPAHACVLSRFSHVLTLCDPMDCSPSGSSVHGILQARILEWVAAGVQPRLIQGIRRRDGFGDLFIYLFIKDIKSNRMRIAQ